MARIFPEGWQNLRSLPDLPTGMRRELETLQTLADGLPDDYAIFHAVHWTTLQNAAPLHGEIDFALVNRAGAVLLIEQKSGFLSETPDGLASRHGDAVELVSARVSRSQHAILGKLQRQLKRTDIAVDTLFYCPDYHVRDLQSAGLVPERIVDASRRAHFVAIVQAILPPGEPDGLAAAVERFMSDTLQLKPDVSALMGQARALATRVAGGLAHWGRQLEFHPHRLRVIGTAGSGKTQLALAEYEASLAAGKRPLYLCYNRPLADHMARVLPPGGLATSFHHLCDLRLRGAGHTPDFSEPGAFERIVEAAAALPVAAASRFDTVIVDEGQDFDPAWREQIFRLATEDARVIWLEDPLQNLYARPAFDAPGWVTLHASTNYRSPRAALPLLQALVPGIEAGSPLPGSPLRTLVYHDTDSLLQRAREALRECYGEGFRTQDVVIVSYQGREKSALMPLDALGTNRLRRFDGRYDAHGMPGYSDGDVLLETVFRFKGQSAPAIVFAEIDFETLDERAVRRLFVGATRAMMKLVLVISARAHAQLAQRL
ncbi:MAG: ATP-binding domain-containing protein [Candidatus Dactylopiibacterium sp.]|nr:ATP-binding domain-containing protein [Candidatus Dactylopiibacterium sp.]